MLSIARMLTIGAFIEIFAANTCARAGQRAHEEIGGQDLGGDP
ncbi:MULTISPECIES: hypothetical protein [Acidiphilium]|nr:MULTISPECIES: hypothetical protein [Acidiphilium]